MEAMIQCDVDAKVVAQHDTFGHLAPVEGEHAITILFCRSVYGHEVIIDDEHITLENSPWQVAAFEQIVSKLCDDKNKVEEGNVYRFTGHITFGEVEGEYENWGIAIGVTGWTGKTEGVYLA